MFFGGDGLAHSPPPIQKNPPKPQKLKKKSELKKINIRLYIAYKI